MKYIVYCTTCKVNGKIYIGVHKTEDPDIFDGYIGNGINVGWTLKNPHTAFQHALKKYGYSQFYRTILYVYDTPEEAYQKEAEIVNIDFVKRSDNYNISLGGIQSGIVYKSLYQYSLEGKFIKEWFSVNEAIQYYGCNSNRFNMAIKDKRSAFNCFWSFERFDCLDTTLYRKSAHSEIYCYDIEGNFYKLYESVQSIIEEFGFKKSSIEDAVSHKRPLKGFYFISDFTNIYNLIKTRNYIYSLSDKSVSLYNNGKIVQTYPSITNASRETKIPIHTIKNSILSGDGKWAYGYKTNFTKTSKPVAVKIEQYDLEGNLVKIWDSMSQCSKEHPKVKEVLSGGRTHTHGFTFKIIE